MIAYRTFTDYGDYVYQQGLKARTRGPFLLAHLAKGTERFAKIFRYAADLLKPGAVLCLGARTGAESLGAVKAGFPGSVGIDLHPVGPTVIAADWHVLPFADASFPNVFTNSLDHCLHLDRFAAEVRRVLQPGGRFYLMATDRNGSLGEWLAAGATDPAGTEALYWNSAADLRDALIGFGFTPVGSWADGKWGHFVFEVVQ